SNLGREPDGVATSASRRCAFGRWRYACSPIGANACASSCADDSRATRRSQKEYPAGRWSICRRRFDVLTGLIWLPYLLQFRPTPLRNTVRVGVLAGLLAA